MKVTIKENQKEKDVEFPCLMVNDQKYIVLITGESKDYYTGMRVGGNPTYRPGYYSETWFKNTNWVPFKGEITLSNE